MRYAGKLGPWVRGGCKGVRYLDVGLTGRPDYKRIISADKSGEDWFYLYVDLDGVGTVEMWCSVNTYEEDRVDKEQGYVAYSINDVIRMRGLVARIKNLDFTVPFTMIGKPEKINDHVMTQIYGIAFDIDNILNKWKDIDADGAVVDG